MVKKLAVLVMIVALAVGVFGPVLPARAATPIRMVLNGRTLTSDVAPVMQNGRTLVPFRTIFEALGASVEWDEKTNTVFGAKGPSFVTLNLNSKKAWLTGKEVQLDVAPIAMSGRTMVPLRFVAEGLGADVQWIEATNTVQITYVQDPPKATQAKAADYNTVYASEMTTMNYLVTATTWEQTVAANTVDGLVEYDNLGILYPSLAKSWKISADGLVYTFNIREGVKWMTWDGKEYADVVAQDFVDAAKYILTKDNASRTANLVYEVVKGAQDYYDGKTTDFSTVGVKALDKYTLQYTLKAPAPYFLTMLTYVSFLPANGQFLAQSGNKFGTDHKNLLYNGAYILRNYEPQNIREYVKNDKYWDKNNVFIGKLTYKYNKEASSLSAEMFLRGDISSTGINNALIDEWMQDPVKKEMVRPTEPSFYTYWYAFNFDPKFAAEYEPENWKIAVNNLNFRKSIFHALHREMAMTTLDPYNPTNQMNNTITPPNFASVGGKDFTQLGQLAKYSNNESFNRTLALDFKNKAMVELKGKVTFPIKVMMPYNTSLLDWTNRVQLVEQQIENLLGKNYIDIIPVGYPTTGFLNSTRRAFNYAIQEVNWGPDYADPQTYTDMFKLGNTYTPISLAAGVNDTYDKLLEAAKAEVVDIQKRYELFAAAEAYLIDQALVIPYGLGGGGYVASKMQPFTSSYAPFGVSNLKFKYQVMLDKPMNTAQYNAARAQWQKDRTAALKKYGQ